MKNQITYSLITFIAMFTCSCSTAPKQQKSPSTLTSISDNSSSNDFPSEIIDAHIHTKFDGKPEETSKIIYSEESMFKALFNANVIGAVSMNSRSGKSYYHPTIEKTTTVTENGSTQTRNQSIQFKNCYGVALPPPYKVIEAGLKSNKYQCIKIYLGYVHAYAYDKMYQPIYKLAETYKVPVVFHTGDIYSKTGKLKYSDPLTIDEVAVDHPTMKIVIAHVGNPWIQSAAEVAYKNENVYVDGSALLIGDLKEYSREDLDTYLVGPLKWAFNYMENPKKLLFATDWPLTDVRAYAEEFKRAIPKEHWEKVFKTNAQEVFGF